MMVSKALQSAAKAEAGDIVSVTMEVDRSERLVPIPPELTQALSTNKEAAEAFKALSYSHRKEFADWIATAKRAETRISRAEKSLLMVIRKQHVR